MRFNVPQLVYYSGVAALVVLGVVEWPLALVVVAGHAVISRPDSPVAQSIEEASALVEV